MSSRPVFFHAPFRGAPTAFAFFGQSADKFRELPDKIPNSVVDMPEIQIPIKLSDDKTVQCNASMFRYGENDLLMALRLPSDYHTVEHIDTLEPFGWAVWSTTFHNYERQIIQTYFNRWLEAIHSEKRVIVTPAPRRRR